MSLIFHVVTLMPEMIEALHLDGLISKARQKGLIEIRCYNPRDQVSDVHKSIDDRPFGGGDGMCMMAEPLKNTLEKIQQSAPEAEIYYLSPQGQVLNESLVQELSQKKELIFVSGRYGGVDQRFLNWARAKEISIGDYVLSGGELAAAVCIDAISRKIPGVLGKIESASQDSFAAPGLEAPLFTRPREWGGMEVPETLLSGDHERIELYRRTVGALLTAQKRPDLIKDFVFDKKEMERMKKVIQTLDVNELKTLGIDEDLEVLWQRLLRDS